MSDPGTMVTPRGGQVPQTDAQLQELIRQLLLSAQGQQGPPSSSPGSPPGASPSSGLRRLLLPRGEDQYAP